MADKSSPDVTALLQNWRRGEERALQDLIPLVYDELHRLAHRYMMRERPDGTLQTSALVNEAYIRLIAARRIPWRDRAHFFAVSANLMRRILVDFARRRAYNKRGGGAAKVLLDDAVVASPGRTTDLVALDDALEALAQFDRTKARVIELRFFGRLTPEETAQVLGDWQVLAGERAQDGSTGMNPARWRKIHNSALSLWRTVRVLIA